MNLKSFLPNPEIGKTTLKDFYKYNSDSYYGVLTRQLNEGDWIVATDPLSDKRK